MPRRKQFFTAAAALTSFPGVSLSSDISTDNNSSFNGGTSSGEDAGARMMTSLLSKSSSGQTPEGIVKRFSGIIKKHRDMPVDSGRLKLDKCGWTDGQLKFQKALAAETEARKLLAGLPQQLQNAQTIKITDRLSPVSGFFKLASESNSFVNRDWSKYAYNGELNDRLDALLKSALEMNPNGGHPIHRIESFLSAFCNAGMYRDFNFNREPSKMAELVSYLPDNVKQKFYRVAGTCFLLDDEHPPTILEHQDVNTVRREGWKMVALAETPDSISESDFLASLGVGWLDSRTRDYLLPLCSAYYSAELRKFFVSGQAVHQIDRTLDITSSLNEKMKRVCRRYDVSANTLVDYVFEDFKTFRVGPPARAHLTRRNARLFRNMLTPSKWTKVASLNSFLSSDNAKLSPRDMAYLAVIVGTQLLTGTLSCFAGDPRGGYLNYIAHASGTEGFRYLQENAPIDADFARLVIQETAQFSRWHQLAAAVAIYAAKGEAGDAYPDDFRDLLANGDHDIPLVMAILPPDAFDGQGQIIPPPNLYFLNEDVLENQRNIFAVAWRFVANFTRRRLAAAYNAVPP